MIILDLYHTYTVVVRLLITFEMIWQHFYFFFTEVGFCSLNIEEFFYYLISRLSLSISIVAIFLSLSLEVEAPKSKSSDLTSDWSFASLA